MEDFNAYRVMCANRLRRLERYKKTRSFCSFEDEQRTINSARLSEIMPEPSEPCYPEAHSSDHLYEPMSPSAKENGSTFEQIREKMMSLVENDMSLLKQLLSLGDQITEMKEKNLRRCQSQNSVDDAGDENEDQFDDRFSASMSAVTTLFVDDADETVQPQYFSRKNSVLRIPIPPRSSNRFGTRRIPRRPSDALRGSSLNIRMQDDAASSSSSEEQKSPSAATCALSYSASSVSTASSAAFSTSTASGYSSAAKITIKNRSSNSSIDSGIRESGPSASPSPTFEKEVA